jgi:hypothetical protein
MSAPDSAELLSRFCEQNLARVRASGRSDDDVTAEALQIYDLWAGIPLSDGELSPLVVHILVAAADALDVDPEVVDEETKAVLWGFASIAMAYAEQRAADEVIAAAEAILAEGG